MKTTYSMKIISGEMKSNNGTMGLLMWDDTKVYDRALTAEQVHTVMTKFSGGSDLTVEAVRAGLEEGHNVILLDVKSQTLALVTLEEPMIHEAPGMVQ